MYAECRLGSIVRVLRVWAMANFNLKYLVSTSKMHNYDRLNKMFSKIVTLVITKTIRV